MPSSLDNVEPSVLTAVLDGRWAGLRGDVRTQLAAADVRDRSDLSTEEYRRQVLEDLRLLAKTEHSRLAFAREYGGLDNPAGSVVAHEMLGFGDLSLMVKAGVQWGLFGGAVQLLGTERHHRQYLRDIIDLSLPGCFAMTETGHGSDVQHLRTTATYDPAAGEFVISTPDPGARKDYIGNAARDGRMAVVFAQLIVDGAQGASHGVHALLVPIRDEDGQAMPGVLIEDCGRKGGLNGVDNGRLTFRDVRVPREALLNRFGDVTADGHYTSPIASDGRRFFTMIGTLIRGRISIAGTAGSAAKRALAIAVAYGNRRRQFELPDGSGEIVLLDYQAHQRKLLPALATTYALSFAQHELVGALAEVSRATALRRASAAGAGVPGGRAQGRLHLAHHRDHPGLPGGVRRGRVPGREPAHDAQGRHRRIHHVRGRQHRAAAAGGQGPADQLPERLRRPGHAGHGPVRGGEVRRRADRADRGAWGHRAADRGGAGPGRRDRAVRPGLAGARVRGPRAAHGRRAGPAAAARRGRGDRGLRGGGREGREGPRGARGARGARSRCSTTSRTTCCGRPGCTWTGSCWRHSWPGWNVAPTRRPGLC